ncbi:MAG: hypothetical protein B7Y80_09455 [Hyphomicrobium sp. 32-62-53]|nr:MAG: hypothetical protein B7Y80_09455 [Hyphomicrobium sp. 32-62-53]
MAGKTKMKSLSQFSRYTANEPNGAGHGAFLGARLNELELLPHEQRLFDALLSRARKLHRKKVPGVYAEVAVLAEAMKSNKQRGQCCLSVLAVGLDQLDKLEAADKRAKLERAREVVREHDLGVFLAVCSVVISVFAAILGISSSRSWVPTSLFWLVAAAALLLPVIWHIATRRR